MTDTAMVATRRATRWRDVLAVLCWPEQDAWIVAQISYEIADRLRDDAGTLPAWIHPDRLNQVVEERLVRLRDRELAELTPDGWVPTAHGRAVLGHLAYLDHLFGEIDDLVGE